MASNDEYQQVKTWKKKEITWIHTTDAYGNKWHFVHHPEFDMPLEEGKEYKNVTKQIIYEN